MLDYLADLYFSWLSFCLGILKAILVKFFVYLIILFIYLAIFFSEVAWEVAQEFIRMSNISQYLGAMYSSLSPELNLILFQTGLLDFISFILTAYVARFVSAYIPFSRL